MRENRGNLFVDRCEKEACDGRHIHLQIGYPGKRPMGVHIMDVAGARNVVAMLVAIIADIEDEHGNQLQ